MNKYILLSIRIIIGVVFIYASIGKIINPEAFAKAIKNYEMLPITMINLPAIILPYLELFTGALLMIGRLKKGAASITIIMLVFFLIGLIQAYIRGLDINCGCFSLESASSKSDILLRIIEDFLMLAGAVIILDFSDKNKIENKTEQI